MRLTRVLELAATTPPAVVLQSSFANGLGIIRDLGTEGVPVIALDPNPRALGFLSRYAAGMVCPDPRRDEEAFLVFLERLGRRLPQRAVVFPTHDEYIWPVARNAERLEPWYHIPFSRWDAMRRLADKQEQLNAAWHVDVDTPRTKFVDSAAELADAAADFEFPAIFKPVESLAFKDRFARPVLRIETRDELERVYERVSDCGTLMLQDIVPGGDDELWTVGSYLNARSEPLAVFTGRKLRQHPRQFGTARFAESVWVPELADAGLRLLGELGYHGVSQVEFKRDPRDGRFRLMEVNARHWLWHSLAAACGVNLSLAAYRDAIGEPFQAPQQIDGRKWIMLSEDLPDLLHETMRHEISPVEWARSLPGTTRDGVCALSDPVPGVVSSYRLVRRMARGRLARLGLLGAHSAPAAHHPQGPGSGETAKRPAVATTTTAAAARRPAVTVLVDAPPELAHKAAWVLTTLLAACGAPAEIIFDAGTGDADGTGGAGATSCVLAYAPRPLPGVPTLPLSAAALDLVTARRALPAGSFAAIDVGAATVPGAFPVAADGPEGASFAVPFDLVASAFVLLAAWDELTSSRRDTHGRFPFAASIFASEPELDIGRPIVDEYLGVVRGLVNTRLADLGRPPLDVPAWGAGSRFALALTHDVDSLRRTRLHRWLAVDERGAAVTRRLPPPSRHLTRLTPHSEPFRTISRLLKREGRLGVSSTFFVLAGHQHPTDGESYQPLAPALLRLLGAYGREVGLHGNHRDVHDQAALDGDRAALAARTGTTVAGMRYHFLKCLYHDTLPMLDDAGFTYDTSLAFAEREGWRCGFSYPFSPYCVAREQPLELVELPLALMDSTLQGPNYRGLAAPQAREAALAVAQRLRATGGGSAVLWHHNRFHHNRFRPRADYDYGDVYWDLLDWSLSHDGVLLPAGELVRRWKAWAGKAEQ